MSFTTPYLGRLGQLYAKIEASYGTVPSLLATDAFRHLDVDLTFSPRKRTNAPDRLQTPDQQRRITHRADASWAIKQALMWPSGTIGTIPELDIFLTHGMGTKHAAALTTTIASAPSTTGAVLTSATGLVKNDAVVINVAGLGRRVVYIVTVATNTVTWAPALQAAPTAGDTVKSGITYKPATDPASTLMLAHYLLTSAGSAPASLARQMSGCVVDKLGLTFDANAEPMISLSGPAQTQLRASAQAQPGAFTTVGAAIPSGISGELRVSAAAYPFLKAAININNNMTVRNAEYGTSQANGFYRKGQRACDVSIDVYVEDPAPIYANAEATVAIPVAIQTGTTEGQIWSVYMPLVEFEIPSTPDSNDELIWSFKGVPLGNLGNDEIFIAQL